MAWVVHIDGYFLDSVWVVEGPVGEGGGGPLLGDVKTL